MFARSRSLPRSCSCTVPPVPRRIPRTPRSRKARRYAPCARTNSVGGIGLLDRNPVRPCMVPSIIFWTPYKVSLYTYFKRGQSSSRGQFHDEFTALARSLGFDTDGPSMRFHDGFCHEETVPRTLRIDARRMRSFSAFGKKPLFVRRSNAD